MPVITIDTAVIISFCAFIAALGGAFMWLKRAMAPIVQPVKDMRADIDDIRAKTVKDYERLNEHEGLLKELRTDNREILKAVLLMLNHIETGNNTGEVAAGRKDLEQYLLTR